MHAHHFAILVALAASSSLAAAHLVAPSAVFAARGSFIRTSGFVAGEPAAPPAAIPATPVSCADSTFSELGHGHPDVASAGFAASHCPPHQAAARPDADLAPSR